MPKPPPWAYPLWTTQEVYRNSSDRMSRSTAQAIDQAMSHSLEARQKFANVSLSVVKQLPRHPINTNAQDIHHGLNRSGLHQRATNDGEFEWVRVVLTADPGVRMDDIGDQEPPRRREHRRVPSTIAIEEVKVGF